MALDQRIDHFLAVHGLAPHGFFVFAEHGFFPAQGFFAPQGLFAPQGFFAPQGLVFGAQGLLPATAGTAAAATMPVTARAELNVRRDFLNLLMWLLHWVVDRVSQTICDTRMAGSSAITS
jgi:hypothetical protein